MIMQFEAVDLDLDSYNGLYVTVKVAASGNIECATLRKSIGDEDLYVSKIEQNTFPALIKLSQVTGMPIELDIQE